MLYVLSYPVFDASVSGRVDTFRTRHEPQRAKLVRPHLTLVFGVNERNLQAVSERVETVSSQMNAFPVTFDEYVTGFDPFEQKHKILLLCGEGAKAVTALHDLLYEGEHRDEFCATQPFQPHMTVATCDTREEIEQVDASALGKLPICGQVRGLELVRFVDGLLTPIKSTALMD